MSSCISAHCVVTMAVVVLHYCLAVVLLWRMDGATALVHFQSPFAAPGGKKKCNDSSILLMIETAFPQQQGLSLHRLYC